MDEKVKTLIDEIGQELELLSHDFESPHIQAGSIRNYRRYWDWGNSRNGGHTKCGSNGGHTHTAGPASPPAPNGSNAP